MPVDPEFQPRSDSCLPNSFLLPFVQRERMIVRAVSVPVTVMINHMQNFPEESINGPKDGEAARLSCPMKNR